VEHREQLVTKAMLLDSVWTGVVVSDSLPATCVAELRAALGDVAYPHVHRDRPSARLSVYRRGYDIGAPPSA
jgi:DNA-binding winged helix-turn-helix (wHTH) protein